MKVLVVMTVIFYAAWAARKCNKGTDSTKLTEEDCIDGTCIFPMFVEYTGISSQAYGCGGCTPEAVGKTCSECTSQENQPACNVAVKEEGAKTFKCFAYTYDKDAKKWTAGKEAETCHAKKDTVITCNSPSATADDKYVTGNGCGPCDKAAKDAKTCEECTKDGCNSAQTLAFVLVPILAAIFHVL